jgi:hypothetical protein
MDRTASALPAVRKGDNVQTRWVTCLNTWYLITSTGDDSVEHGHGLQIAAIL